MIKAIEAVANPVQEEKQEALKNHEEDVSAETSRRGLMFIAPEVDSSTAVTNWRGEDCDYGVVVEGSLARDEGDKETRELVYTENGKAVAPVINR